MTYVSKEIIRKIYGKRKPWSHKGEYGRLLVVAGSEFLTGSPVFVSLAAYRAGCDLVFLAAPERPALVAASYAPEIMAYPLKGKYLGKAHAREIRKLERMSQPDALVIGPGLWREKQTLSVINEIIKKANLPMVIDADAIRALSLKPDILKGKKAIVTPHSQEFFGLTRKFATYNLKQRKKAAEEAARALQTTILLKGHVDVITDGKRTALNKTGSPFITKGGCGDTLAGICGAMLARGIEPFTAASAAAYINGRAGEIAAKKKGEGILPTDLIEEIPNAIK